MTKFKYLEHTLQEYYLAVQQDLENSIKQSQGTNTPSYNLVLINQVRLEVIEDIMETMKTIEQLDEGKLDAKVH